MPYAEPPKSDKFISVVTQFKTLPDPYTVRTNVNKATGEIHRTYFYKRKACYRVVLDSPLAKQLAGYTLIEKDLRSALIWIEKIAALADPRPAEQRAYFGQGKDRETYNIIKGLMVATLTFYGKCFAKTGARRIKLERSQLDPRFHKIHDNVMEYRHNFAAHSGDSPIERVEIALVFPQNPRTIAEPNLYRELMQPDHIESSNGQIQTKELIEHVQSFVNQKINFLIEKILREEVAPPGREGWTKKARGG
ncbi:hypothetical protein [Variovorax paradoxus]|uniref:Uncharacterized protein n=1 Tax=Variovorax paradoxus TaxID=34073 RepID=A0A679JHZ4_VARPD|nr:hypothetical protein VVAX_03476 [Variovorax paradoxus]